MWKMSLIRGACSYCICVTINILVCLILCLSGVEAVCTPAFAARVGSAAAASFLQPLLIGLIGFAFGAGSVLFEIERWSFLRQGALHIALTAAVWIVVELICFSPITQPVVISFTCSILFTYTVTWIGRYLVWRAQIRRLNEQIHQMNDPMNGGTHERH